MKILKNIPVRHLPMFMQFLVHLFHCCFLLIESIRCCVSCKSGEADRSNAFFHLDAIIILIFIKGFSWVPLWASAVCTALIEQGSHLFLIVSDFTLWAPQHVWRVCGHQDFKLSSEMCLLHAHRLKYVYQMCVEFAYLYKYLTYVWTYFILLHLLVAKNYSF